MTDEQQHANLNLDEVTRILGALIDEVKKLRERVAVLEDAS